MSSTTAASGFGWSSPAPSTGAEAPATTEVGVLLAVVVVCWLSVRVPGWPVEVPIEEGSVPTVDGGISPGVGMPMPPAGMVAMPYCLATALT